MPTFSDYKTNTKIVRKKQKKAERLQNEIFLPNKANKRHNQREFYQQTDFSRTYNTLYINTVLPLHKIHFAQFHVTKRHC